MTRIRQAVALPVIAAMVGGLVVSDAAWAGARESGLRQSVAEAPVAVDMSARKKRTHVRHYRGRHYRNNAAAAAMFGMVAGTIAQVAIAQSHRRHARYYYYDDGVDDVYYAPAPVYQTYVPPPPVYRTYVQPAPVYAPVYRPHVARPHIARPHVVGLPELAGAQRLRHHRHH